LKAGLSDEQVFIKQSGFQKKFSQIWISYSFRHLTLKCAKRYFSKWQNCLIRRWEGSYCSYIGKYNLKLAAICLNIDIEA
jgi:hypothetical protein